MFFLFKWFNKSITSSDEEDDRNRIEDIKMMNASLQEENDQLKKDLLLKNQMLVFHRQEFSAMIHCVECKANIRQVIFLPCGHLALCADCAHLCDICPVPKCGQVKRKTFIVRLPRVI